MSGVLNYEPDKSDEIMRDAETVLSPLYLQRKAKLPLHTRGNLLSRHGAPGVQGIIRPRSGLTFLNFGKVITVILTGFTMKKMIILSRAIVMEDEYKGDLTIQINPQKLLESTASPNFFNYNIALFLRDGGCIYSSILPKDKGALGHNRVFGTEENTKFGVKDFLIKSIKLENGLCLPPL